MNLEKLKVVELDAQEVKSVEGGVLPLVVVAMLAVDCFVLGTMTSICYHRIKKW
jgi:lactobin A/cerein 7B family class IIb bacteriocin